jgi:isoquinoline 1-oxidoreductase
VSEELRLPVDRVEVVMGDTDVCPWDMGTFGSRSMPDAAPALRAVAAAARECLISFAAERSGRPSRELAAADGQIRATDDTPGITYGALVAGRHQVEVVAPGVPHVPTEHRTREVRATGGSGAEDIVTGRREYISDLHRPGMLHGAVLHPPRHGATLLEIDLEPARQRSGIIILRQGEFVGAVGPSPAAARSALAALAPHWTVPDSPGESEMEAFLRSHPDAEDVWDKEEQVLGDAEGELRRASLVVEGTYRAAYIAHIPLETRCAIAEWTGPRVTVWVGSQTPFRIRDELAKGLDLPVEDVRVIATPTGSGFGGKHRGEVALAAARLARVAAAPVRVGYTREEEFQWAYLRPLAIIDLKVAADPSGRLLAWYFHNVNAGAAALLPPYAIPHQRVDNQLALSPLPQGSYRALGATANNFARECALDEIAFRCGVGPLEIRERNLSDDRLRTVLRRAAEKARWGEREYRPGRGFGLAVGLEKDARVATVAQVTVEPDRRLRVERLITVFEAGAIVHPDNLRNQVEGAMVMALGGALFEEIRFDPGVVRNPRLSEYRVPRFSDLPSLEVELLDRPDLPSSGAGETPMIAVAPAVANAIFDATGWRGRRLPLVPDGRVPTERSN